MKSAAVALRDLPDWPAALTEDEAMAYTRLSRTDITRYQREGIIRFLPHGANGTKICPRDDLDGLLKMIWAREAGRALDDMEF